VIRFIDANAPRTMTGGMEYPETVIPQFNHRISQETEVCPERLGMAVKVLPHDNKFILDLYLVCRKAVGCEKGFPIKIGTGSDVIKVLVGQNNEVNVFGFQFHLCKAIFQEREICSDSRIDEDILHITFDEVHMASRPLGTDLEDIGP
jgi:hypothetical protein